MFGKQITLFRMLGFEVRVDLSWLVIALLVTWSLAEGVFRQQFPNMPASSRWAMGLFGAVGFFASIVLHELCHSLVARTYKLPMKGITLFIFGGVAEMEDEPPSAKAEFFIAIAGPVSSVVIAGGFWGLSYLMAAASVAPLAAVFAWLAIINVVLVVFNLIPGFPLDGGRVLRSILWGAKGDLRWATKVASVVGSTFGVMLIMLGVLEVISGNFIGGLWWFLIGLFIRNAARQGYEQILVRGALRGEPVRKFMSAEPVVVPPDISVEQLVEDFVYRFHFKMFPVSADGKLNGCISTREIQDIPRRQWAFRRVSDVLTQCSVDNTITPDHDAMDALAQMNRSKTSRLLVVEGDRLVGVITLKDLLEFLALKLELEGVDAPKGLRDATGEQSADNDRRAA